MKPQQVFVIGMGDTLREPLTNAVQRVFPGVALTALETFSQAQTRPQGEVSVLVLVEPAASVVAGAKTGLDSGGLVRWPVLVLGSKKPAADVEWLGPEEWNEQTLARALRHVVEKHGLACESARLRGDLLTVARRVNHDLRSSLNGVMTASEVIKEILGTEKPEDMELIQPVVDSAAEIARLIDQVSFVARATATPLSTQVLPMDELVWKGLARVERRILEKKAHVAHAEVWPKVVGVAPWIEGIWTDLISNAIDHTGVNPHVELGWGEGDAEYVFWVDDRGPGVGVERRNALFRPFHRLSEPGTMRGFGLSVVQRLVELQGGRCGYEPREGGGARFYFTLPKAQTT
ncbi:MAG: HAMP domain-containing sensor histidine kinase [Nibricoccus sp.]